MKPIKLKKIIEENQHEKYILRQKNILKIAKRLTAEMKQIVHEEFGV